MSGAGSTSGVGTQKSFYTGAKSSIGTSVVQISSSTTYLNKGILVKAAKANSGTVYVGSSGVTAGTTDATDGFELGAGESIFIETDRLDRVYAIASASSQKVFWVAV